MKRNLVAKMKALILIGMALGLSACGLFSRNEDMPEPNPLTDIKEEVKVTEVWSHSVGNGQGKAWLKLEPAVDGDTLYIANAKGLVMAVGSHDGKLLWQKKLDVQISGGVTAAEGLVIVGTLGGYVLALKQNDGTELWRTPTTSEVLSAPAVDDDVVVVQTIDGKVAGLLASTGKQLWQQETLQPLLTLRGSSSPLAVDGMVFAVFANGEARTYRVANGSLVWNRRVATPKGSSEIERMVDLNGTPVLVSSSLYMVSYQGNISALDPDTGRIRWTHETSSFQGLAEGFGNLYLSDDQSILSAVDQRSGSVIWSQKELKHRELSAPTTWSSYVLIGDYEGYLHVVSQVDGQLLGRKKIDSSGIRAKPIVSGDMIYVYGNSGTLSALSIR
ncbi:MAG: outer membrane protein assembly factor BamB [Endozoicomonadaceae bacterium]|nr:outer membrane protein assembly factor BamB [Endozoicomonadaceae bacterium]